MTWLLLGILSIVLIQVLWVRFFKKLSLLDKPWPDVPARDRVPTIQWVVWVVALIAWVMISGNGSLLTDSGFVWLWIWWALIFLITFSDELWRIWDRRLRVWALVRLIVQIIASIIAWWMSYEALFPIGIFGYEIQWVVWFLVLIAWFLLFINAINWFDGVYGLSTGVASIWFRTIAILLPLVVVPAFPDITTGKLLLLDNTTVLAILFGVMTLVWTYIEFKPWWLMRDVGTMTIGFALAYLSLVWWAKIWTLIVVLALPLMDAAWVILDRLIRRRINPMKWDFTHLHYRLMALGRSRTEVRVSIWVASVCFAILMLLQWTNSMNKVVIFVMAVALFFGINIYLFWIKWVNAEYTRKKLKWKEE